MRLHGRVVTTKSEQVQLCRVDCPRSPTARSFNRVQDGTSNKGVLTASQQRQDRRALQPISSVQQQDPCLPPVLGKARSDRHRSWNRRVLTMAKDDRHTLQTLKRPSIRRIPEDAGCSRRGEHVLQVMATASRPGDRKRTRRRSWRRLQDPDDQPRLRVVLLLEHVASKRACVDRQVRLHRYIHRARGDAR